jgi:hypothetical protein
MLKGVPAVAIVGAFSTRWSTGPPLTTTIGCFFCASGRKVGLTTYATRLTIVFVTRFPVFLFLTTFFTLTSFVAGDADVRLRLGQEDVAVRGERRCDRRPVGEVEVLAPLAVGRDRQPVAGDANQLDRARAGASGENDVAGRSGASRLRQ